MQYKNERIEFYSRLAGLIAKDAESKKNSIAQDDPDAGQKRRAINEQRQQDMQKLRKWYWGRKADQHCSDCEYYDFWEKETIKKGSDSDCV